jgi:hypothetical protein
MVIDNIPPSLKALHGWLLWRFEGDGLKPRKVPYYVKGAKRSGTQGSPEDRSSLATFADAYAALQQGSYAGLGLAMLPEWGLTALDFDGCVVDDVVTPAVLDLVDSGYWEVSPSGTGVRAFVRGNLGNHKSHKDRWPDFGFETFNSNGFVTITGNTHPTPQSDSQGPMSIPPVLQKIRDLCAERFGTHTTPPLSHPRVTITPTAELESFLHRLDPDMSYYDWLKVGMAVHHETGGEGFELWNGWSANGRKYPNKDELAKKWQTFKRTDGPLATLPGLMRKMEASPTDFPNLMGQGDRVAKFTPISLVEFLAKPPPAWLIKGVLPAAGLGMVYGASGAGKSFFTLDVIMAIAQGTPWRGRKVKQGDVVYVAAEGASGMRNRVNAYLSIRSLKNDFTGLRLIEVAPNFHGDADIGPLQQALQQSGAPTVLVIDTLAQTTAGADENAGQDMGAVFAKLQALQQALGCLVLLVHHAGKDAARGARGWSGMKAALDVEIEVAAGPEGVRMATVTKQKDGEGGLQFPFKLVPVHLGFDVDGDANDSCIVEPVEKLLQAVAVTGELQQALMQELLVMCTSEVPWVKESELVDATYLELKENGEGKIKRKDSLKRGLQNLVKQGAVMKRAKLVTLPHFHKSPQSVNCVSAQATEVVTQSLHHPIGVEDCGSQSGEIGYA